MKKRITAVLLVLAMLIGILPVGVFAASENTQVITPYDLVGITFEADTSSGYISVQEEDDGIYFSFSSSGQSGRIGPITEFGYADETSFSHYISGGTLSGGSFRGSLINGKCNIDIYYSSGARVVGFTGTKTTSVISGTCGDNLTWTLENGVLTIGGTGDMTNYYVNEAPWHDSYFNVIKNVIIGSSVTSIGNYAFVDCRNLTSISIPDSVASIGKYAFYGCRSLANTTIPDSVTSIGDSAFESCSSLTSITIPDGITSIEFGTFLGCDSLTSVTIPDSVTSIEKYAFSSCSRLTGITIPDSVISIGTAAFGNCSSLTSITIPGSVTSIEWGAFHGCSSLTSITIPDSVTSIGDEAFYNCSSLTDVYYSGSESEWAAMSIGTNNECLTDAIIHYNSTGPDDNGGTLSFDESSYTCAVNKTISISATYISETEPEDITWTCSDDNAVSFSGTSIQGPSVTGEENTYWISVQVTAKTAGEYEINLNIDGITASTGFTVAVDLDNPTDSDYTPATFFFESPDSLLTGYRYGSTMERYYCVLGGSNNEYADGNIMCAVYQANIRDSIGSEAQNVVWAVKDNSVLEISSVTYNVHNNDYEENSWADYKIELSPKNYGHTMLAGKAGDGREIYISMYVEPTLHIGTDGNCYVELDSPNTEYLKDFLSGISVYGDKNYRAVDLNECVISADGKSGHFTLNGYGGIYKIKTRGGQIYTWQSPSLDGLDWLNTEQFLDNPDFQFLSNKQYEFQAAFSSLIEAAQDILREEGEKCNQATAPTVEKLAENLKNDGIEVTFVENSKKNEKYVFQALAEVLAGKTNAKMSNISYSSDITTYATNIVKSVINDFKSINQSIEFDNGKVIVDVNLAGQYGAWTGSVNVNGGFVAMVSTTTAQITNVLQQYLDDLANLEKTALNNVFYTLADEILEGVGLTSFAEQTISGKLKKYEQTLREAELGDFIDLCETSYKFYQALPSFNYDYDEDDIMSQLDNMWAFVNSIETKSDSITNATAKKALKNLKKAARTLYEAWYDYEISGGNAPENAWEQIKNGIISIFSCPVSVTVYDNTGTMIGYSGNDDLWYDDKIYIEETGDAIIVYSPKEIGASFKVVGTGYGSLNCAFEERDEYGIASGRLVYYNIPISLGTTVTAALPKGNLIVDNSTLSLNVDGTSKAPDICIPVESYSPIDVSLRANNNEAGILYGAGSYVQGDAIHLIALANEGYMFTGWFDENDRLVTVKRDFEFVARDDINYTAKFASLISQPDTPSPDNPEVPISSTTIHTISIPTTENGTITVSPKNAIGGQTVTITATPDEGYELDTLTVTDAKGNELELKDLGSGKYSFKMPYSKVTVNATFTETEPAKDPVKDCAKDGTCPAAKFTDVDLTAWYHDGVHYCIAEGLMNGTSTTTFEPLAITNRAMLVTILYRLEGEPAVGENQFTDVAADEWYTKAVAWAADNGIVKGYGDGKFGPMDTITREQMATILHRYAAYKGYDVTAKGDLSFTDADEVSDWARDAMTWAVGAELINGVGDNKLEPEGDAQRAQIATILYRFCENIVK